MSDWMVQLIGYAGVGVGLYVGIRSDLARLHERVASAADAARTAHQRIDGLLIQSRGMHG